jgi:autotransporter-associated beta strand protein
VLDLSAADDLIGGGTLVMAGGTLLLGRTSQAVSDLEIRGGVMQSEEGGAIRVADLAAQTPPVKVLKAIVDTAATLNASILEDNSTTRLSKTGVGLLVLNRENDFGAGVELNAGILEVGTHFALGGSMLFWNGGTLRANSVAQEIANPVRFQSANVMQIGGPSAGALTFSGRVDLGAKAALNVVSDTVFAGVVSGGSLEMVGPGRLILSATNTFVGSTIVSKGNLQTGPGGLAATSHVEVAGARLELVDFNPAAPMRVRAGGLVQFSAAASGSGSIVLEGGTIQAGAGGSQVLRPVSVQGGDMSVIAGGASTFVGHTQVSAGSSLKVKGVVAMKSLMLSGGVLIPDGVTLTTGSFRAAMGSQLTWDLRSIGGTAIEVTSNDKVEVSDLSVSIPTQSLGELASKILPVKGKALVGAGQSAVVGTLISTPGNLDVPQNFEAGAATLRFRLNKQGNNSVVITVDRSTLSKTVKSARATSFLAALDAVNAASDMASNVASNVASNSVPSPAVPTPGASAAAAQGSQSIATSANVSAPANQSGATSLVGLLRAIEQLQSAEQIRAMLSPLDGGRGYADLTAAYGLAGLALSGPLDAHLDGLASAGFADSSVSFGVRATPVPVVAHDDESSVRNSPPHAARAEVWIAGYGLSSRLSADPVREYGALNASGGGSVFGLERRHGDLRFGGIVIVGQSTSRVSDPELNLETEHWNVGGYGSVRFGRVTVDGSALFGVSSRESERQLFGETAEADFKTKDWQLALGLSMNLAQPGSGWEISPVLRLKYLRSDQDGFNELGSMAPISSEPMVTNRLFSRVGLRLGRHSQVTPNLGLGLFGAAYWLHDYTARGPEMRFRLAGVPYQTRARDSEPDLLQFNMGVHAALFQSWTLNLAAQRDIGAERVQQTGVLSVGFRF